MTALPPAEYPLKYRPDIDGLRALAVLSVVLYHLGLPLSGGYVGVDVFFTISGFLIGSIILKQTAERRFTFAGFYERRIRRIFPALFVMLVATSALAYRYLFPVELDKYAKSLEAVAFSVSNGFFWLQSGYFDEPASETPLLHTWSLAVEEQFYVFLPIVLVLLHRYVPKRINVAIGSIAAISFLVAAVGAYRFPTGSFFLPHTRAWELLLGTMLALDGFPKLRGPLMRQVAAVTGLILIACPLVLYSASTPFPGLAALPPCLGTALIIAAGESGANAVGRLLSLKPVVFVGLISYSLYLWHWPVMVFYRFGFTPIGGLSHHQSQLMLFTLSVLLAIASWRFVEMPLRSKAVLAGRGRLFSAAAVATVAMVAFGAAVAVSRGMPERFRPEARQVAEYMNFTPADGVRQYRDNTCFIFAENATARDFSVPTCLPDLQRPKTFLVLGDSHAAALWWGLNKVYTDVNVMQATASGCKPVLTQRPRQRAVCTAIMNFALREYLPAHKVDAVLIEAHWDDGDLAGIGETVAWLQAHAIPVILLGPVVQYDISLPRLLATAITLGDPLLPGRHLLRFVRPLDLQMKELSRDRWRVPYISMLDLFCDAQACTQYAAPGVPLLVDYGHLTMAGAELAAQRMAALGVLPMGPGTN